MATTPPSTDPTQSMTTTTPPHRQSPPTREEFFIRGVVPVTPTPPPTPTESPTKNDCAICLESLTSDIIQLLACNHQLHFACVVKLCRQEYTSRGIGSKRVVHKHVLCPLCRTELYCSTGLCAGDEVDDEDLLNGEAAEEIPDNEVFVYPFQDSDSDDELWPLEELDSDDGLWSSEEEDSDDELWPPEELDSDEEVHLSEEQNSHEAPWATEQYREELRRSLSFALMESERKLGLYRVFTAVCITALLVYLATFSVYLGPLIDRLWWRCWKYTCCVVKHYYARLPELLDTILGCWECTCFMAEHYHERLLVLLDRV